MPDYKHTLNLPYTAFPMKANLQKLEPIILAKWEALSLYTELRKHNQRKPLYILHDGPPYANGPIHMGHAVNKILKDIIIKSKNLAGFDVVFIPGWDCHGLPIELNVEKKQSFSKSSLSSSAFRKACREHAKQQIIRQQKAFERLGVLADWSNLYCTMDFSFEANTIRALGQMLKQGYVKPGFKPVHWCVECTSALAEAEVEYISKTSWAIDVRFQVVGRGRCQVSLDQGQGKLSIPAWTTTPWTLPGNAAVALSAKSEYALVQIPGERLLLAKELIEPSLLRYGIKTHRILGCYRGVQLEDLQLEHPFYERQVPVILADHVTMDVGTGAVHIGPSHGQDDYLVSLKYQLPLFNWVDEKGCYSQDTPLFGGESVFQVDESILATLHQGHTLLCQQEIQHNYPHCWRHKTPLIFRATQQWFVDLEQSGLRAAAFQAINKVQWFPEWGQARMQAMLSNRPDWCLSRQRVWGVPMPFFIHRITGNLHPETPVMLEEVAKRVEQGGIEAWYEHDIEAYLGQSDQEYSKLEATLDVWFDSGVTHYCVLAQNPQLAWPADLYLEGSDQYRGWFQSSLLTAVAMNNQAPYRAVLTHGYVVDEQGRKMSKSLGNVVDPNQVVDRLGADILRLWVASVDYRTEITVSDQILHRVAEAYRRIRNTLRFLLANLHDFDPSKQIVKSDTLLSLDRWILKRAAQLQQEIQQAYETYFFHPIYHKIHNFCIKDLGGFYLDVIKDRQYTLPQGSLPRRSAQTALYHIAEAMLRWLAPLLSFTAEEAWSYLPGKRPESLFLSGYYALEVDWQTDLLAGTYEKMGGPDVYWGHLIQVREAVNHELEKWRRAGHIGSSLEAEVEMYCLADGYLATVLQSLQNELRFILIVSEAYVFTADFPDQAAEVCIGGDRLLLRVISIVAQKAKCERCWHRRHDVGQDLRHPTLCLRCVGNLTGCSGEERLYV